MDPHYNGDTFLKCCLMIIKLDKQIVEMYIRVINSC
jgi:hypothetical protein